MKKRPSSTESSAGDSDNRTDPAEGNLPTPPQGEEGRVRSPSPPKRRSSGVGEFLLFVGAIWLWNESKSG